MTCNGHIELGVAMIMLRSTFFSATDIGWLFYSRLSQYLRDRPPSKRRRRDVSPSFVTGYGPLRYSANLTTPLLLPSRLPLALR